MSNGNPQEWEQYDARMLEDSPVARATLPSQRSGRDFLQSPVESPGNLEGPFLLSNASEIAAETERRAWEADRRLSAGTSPQFGAEEAELPTHNNGCGCSTAAPVSAKTATYTETEGLEERELESAPGGAFEERSVDYAAEKASRSDSLEFDPYSGVRSALRPEHASLAADELTVIVGPQPTLIALHRMLASPEPQLAALAVLLGKAGRRSMRLEGSDVPIPAYLRRLSRLCREAAEQSETQSPDVTVGAEGAPQQEQQLAPGGGTKTLSGSVGRKGKNQPDDVGLVQRLLNSNLPIPPTRLSENGTIDESTMTAIENYQKEILGSKSPDGSVEPKGQTFQSLVADKFCFLPHRCQPLAGPSISVDATAMNPGFLTPTGVTRDAGLQAIVDRRVLTHPSLRELRFALVDLTGAGKLASPQFAGHRETEQGGLGSMAKLACMYAAYQLKFDLEELSRQNGITTLPPLFEAARALWKDSQKPDAAKVTQLFPSGPKIELVGKLVAVDGKPLPGPRGLSTPDLERIFKKRTESAGGLILMFEGSDHILVDPSVPGSVDGETAKVKDYTARGGADLREVRKLSFAERLFLMIDDSDNAAAHSCIEDIGFLFIASAIWQSDFYRPERGGGLWESSTHDGGARWLKPPVPRGNRATDFVSATAASVAALLTLLEQGRLVNRDACAGMKQMMNKNKGDVHNGSHTRSYFLEGLRPGFTPQRIHSKLGIGDRLNDCAIIVRTVPDPADPATNKEIRYVAAGFDDPTPATRKPAVFLDALILELDKCVRENDGLLATSAP